jgi:hypothetical protein
LVRLSKVDWECLMLSGMAASPPRRSDVSYCSSYYVSICANMQTYFRRCTALDNKTALVLLRELLDVREATVAVWRAQQCICHRYRDNARPHPSPSRGSVCAYPPRRSDRYDHEAREVKTPQGCVRNVSSSMVDHYPSACFQGLPPAPTRMSDPFGR